MMGPLAAGSIADCHTHTRFSDGVGTFEENARAAAAAGCAVLVSTDHLTLPEAMDPTGSVQVVEGELVAHRAAWEAARDAHPELEMVYGYLVSRDGARNPAVVSLIEMLEAHFKKVEQSS